MPRPQTKAELLAAAIDGYARINGTIESLTTAQQTATFPFDHRDKNVRDVLAHLHEWQRMMLRWYDSGMDGSKPDMPAVGYTWNTTPDLNAAIWAECQQTSLDSIQKQLAITHQQLLALIDQHTNAELFTKRRYAWTGTTSLGSYLVSATSSHYDWACKLLRRYVRTCAQNIG